MFQPQREFTFKNVRRIAARQAGALAIAGLLALPLFATQGSVSLFARGGPSSANPASSGPAPASVEGPARVVDGDTIAIQSVTIRLEGIDAPEIEQTCNKPANLLGLGGTWKCGREASDHVARLVRDRNVRCDGRGADAYGRMLGVCVVEGLEINGDLVRQGLAWAFVKYSQRYVALEAEARADKRGIWQAETKPAWIWRAERWQQAQSEKPEDAGSNCLIKGNITRTGQIYHMPWDRWYDKTRIETAKGERWFCSEGEAVAAGWRPALAR